MNNFKHENKCYTVALIRKGKLTPFVMDLPHMTLAKAEQVAKKMNNEYYTLFPQLKGVKCVAYNTTAVTMRPPYMVDMEQEWNYVLDPDNESLYTELNTHSGGTI